MSKEDLEFVLAELMRHATDSESLDKAIAIVERALKENRV